MQITFGKVLAAAIGVVYAVYAYTHLGASGLKWCLGLVLPLGLIWFPEEIGNLTGYFRTGYVNVQTPGAIISFLGWLFLLGLPLAAYLIRYLR